MRANRTSLWAATTLLHSACGADCTLRPCPGLAVQLEGAIPAEYSVTLSSPGEQPVTRTCTLTSPCPGNLVRFIDQAPDVATVSVVGPGTSVEVAVEPSYDAAYPNGPDCGECRTGTITLELQ